MIDLTKFEFIKKKYGHYASWAIWASEGEKPKDNVGDLSVLDLDINHQLLQHLNPNIILVGLNISRRIEKPLANFHDSSPKAMDYKIRFALKDSPLWGGYMTDIIKDFEQKVSGKMMSYLNNNKSFERENINIFSQEINDLGVTQPFIIAFGGDAYKILRRNLHDEFKIFKISHYSHYMGKEKYREEVKSMISLSTHQNHL